MPDWREEYLASLQAAEDNMQPEMSWYKPVRSSWPTLRLIITARTTARANTDQAI
jgi:hypothetical protein